MKVLHSSDLLLGMAFPHAADRAEELRAARFEALRSLLALASREGADLLLLAGNTIADNRIGQGDLAELLAILSTSPVPVYLLPGLTDPYTPDSPYANLGAPVHVLRDRTPVAVGDLTLVPFPVRARKEAPDWRVEVSGHHLGVACALPPAAPQGLNYVAMGGSARPHQEGTAHWCGTPEGYDYGHGIGAASLIELPTSRSIPVGRLPWTRDPVVPAERPLFHHPLLKSMAAELEKHDDAEVGQAALERLNELAAGHPDLV